MSDNICLCSVVTESLLEEFLLLKYSFELFHGPDHQWYLRCDRVSADVLSRFRQIRCHIFADHVSERPDIESRAFRDIVLQKMNVLDDAWASKTCEGTLFLDADITITAPLLPRLRVRDVELILTPNYYAREYRHLISLHGYYNAGLVFSRTDKFHIWWKTAFNEQSETWTDQAVLNGVKASFQVRELPENANVGFWRSANFVNFVPIPQDCIFIHVHFLQPLRSVRQWRDRAFALHCIEFLRDSGEPSHQTLFREIMSRDRSGWYQASLLLR